jgi:hypothetical protein
MAVEMWYYTTEGKQMDPVSIRELRRLVEDGLLKPTDMVWKDGMARWIRASSVKELFPDPGSELDKYFATSGNQSAAAAIPANSTDTTPAPAPSKPSAKIDDDDEPRPQRRKRRSAGADDDDRPSRRGVDPKASNSGIILIAVILGGGLVLFAVVVGVLILIFARGGPARPAQGVAIENPVPVPLVNKNASYVEAIQPLGIVRRTIKLQRGVTYEFTVRSEPRHPDVDLHILNHNGAEEEADVSFGPDSFKRWAPREDGDYKIELRNLDEFTAVKSTVTIREVAGAPIEKKPITEPPLPKDVLGGNGSLSLTALKPGDEQTFKLRVKGGKAASVNVTSFFKKADKTQVDLNVYVVKDSDGSKIGEDVQPGPSAALEFTLPTDETVRVRVHNAGKAAASRGMIFYKTAP